MKKHRTLRILAKIAYAFVTAPPEARDVLDEAGKRVKLEVERLDAHDPTWRDRPTFDGPESHVRLFQHIEEIVRERGLTDRVQAWARELFKEENDG